MTLVFVTSNPNKFKEAQKILDIKLKQSHIDVPEIQADSLTEIAKEAAKYAFEELGEPCFVEDSGLFIHDLHGFPGPYSKYVYYTIGLEGVLKLMEGKKNRGAEFRSAIGYADSRGIKTFLGRVYGEITEEPRGSGGFGYDPIFKPLNHDKTFAEDPEYKNKVSHRSLALKRLAEYLSIG